MNNKCFIANEAGSSTAMEFHGNKVALTHLLTKTTKVIKTYITDRHGAIGKWMREVCPIICKELGKPKICHYLTGGMWQKVSLL